MSISIHAPRTGSDTHFCRLCIWRLISIHAPRTGSDLTKLRAKSFPASFQSTLPARGATPAQATAPAIAQISIHAPRTGSDFPVLLTLPIPKIISIHAPRTGSDKCGNPAVADCKHFNPRSPHGERQRLPPLPPTLATYFNPRSPHGERHRHGAMQR